MLYDRVLGKVVKSIEVDHESLEIFQLATHVEDQQTQIVRVSIGKRQVAIEQFIGACKSLRKKSYSCCRYSAFVTATVCPGPFCSFYILQNAENGKEQGEDNGH